MTTPEKIKNLNWFDFLRKIKEILLEVFSSAGAVKEAPEDGEQYARKDGEWSVIINSGGGIPDAPLNGNTYGRNNGNWVESAGLSDIPIKVIDNKGSLGYINTDDNTGFYVNRDDSDANNDYISIYTPINSINVANGFTTIQSKNTEGGIATITVSSPNISNANINFQFITQDKLSGSYIVATLDDIPEPIDTGFKIEPYASTMSVAYDSDNPNFEVTATGNLNLTLTGTQNGDAGIVNIYFSGGTRNVVLNGIVVLEMIETNVMARVSYIHDKDGLKWHRDLNWREDGNVFINANNFKQNGDVEFGGSVKFPGNFEIYLGDLKLSPNGEVISSAGGNNPTDVGFRRNSPKMWEVNNGTAEQYANIKVKTVVLAASYANDAAASADVDLPIGGLYYLTGNSAPKVKLA